MLDSLLQAYTPLLTWISIGVLLFRFIPINFSTQLGRVLYWVGVPVQSFIFGRRTQLSQEIVLIPLLVVEASLLGIGLALVSWWGWQKFNYYNAEESSKEKHEQFTLEQCSNLHQAYCHADKHINVETVKRSRLGSFILAAMLGNTGFIGMTLAKVLIDPLYLNWAIIYNVCGIITYSLAVFIASYFGQSRTQHSWWTSLRDVLTVPSQWAFVIGLFSQDVQLPLIIESGLEIMIWLVFASALFLLGLRLGSIKGWLGVELAIIPAALKVLVVPAVVGLTATYLGLTGQPRLVLVLMSGVPTGLATLILAEVYDLERDLLIICATLTLMGILVIVPLWLAWFS